MTMFQALLATVAFIASTAGAGAMRLDVPYEPGRSCTDSRSPTILLQDVPDGTRSLKVRIRTLGGLSSIPTVRQLPYEGNRLPPGAVRHLVGCGAGERGRAVEIEISARDASGRHLARARDTAYYPAP